MRFLFLVNFKLFALSISFTFACLLIGKRTFTLLSHVIYSTSGVVVRNRVFFLASLCLIRQHGIGIGIRN
ncbi:MAG: hypothetical protein LBC74_01345 [Planctomycetaceae bacterium]|nr:hypothetical protein [Planctomycetaceae bacterium]